MDSIGTGGRRQESGGRRGLPVRQPSHLVGGGQGDTGESAVGGKGIGSSYYESLLSQYAVRSDRNCSNVHFTFALSFVALHAA
jgi:hypothetical protein